MMPDQSEIATLQSQLEVALQRIQVLEDQVSQQQKVIQAQREDQSFRKGVIERAAEGVCVCHDIPTFPYVKFTVWNQRMVDITGYTMEEINARGWYQSIYPDPEVQQRAHERMDRMRKGEDLRFERWEMTRRNGEKRSVAISTSILTTKNGSVHVMALMHDFTEEEHLKTEALLARIDDLTQVKNRRGFIDDAGLLFKLASRQTLPIVIAYLDVDNLKMINDSFGHGEGDQVLKAVGRTLTDSLRSTDIVGRLGGDEFAFVLFDLTASDAKMLVGRLHQRLLKMMRDHGWDTGVSIGVVSFSDAIPDIDDAVGHADALMYNAKKAGKSRLIFEYS